MLCAIAVVYLTEWLGMDAAESCLVFWLSSVSGLHDFYRQCRDMTGEFTISVFEWGFPV